MFPSPLGPRHPLTLCTPAPFPAQVGLKTGADIVTSSVVQGARVFPFRTMPVRCLRPRPRERQGPRSLPPPTWASRPVDDRITHVGCLAIFSTQSASLAAPLSVPGITLSSLRWALGRGFGLSTCAAPTSHISIDALFSASCPRANSRFPSPFLVTAAGLLGAHVSLPLTQSRRETWLTLMPGICDACQPPPVIDIAITLAPLQHTLLWCRPSHTTTHPRLPPTTERPGSESLAHLATVYHQL